MLLLGDGAMRVRVETGVVDRDDVGAGLQGVADSRRIGRGLTGTQVQSLSSTVGKPRVKRRGDGADGVLQEREPLEELLAVEGGDTHDDVAVAVDVLGDTVHHNIGAVIKRVLDVRAQEGVVDNNHDAVLVGSSRDGADVDETEGRVAGSLDPYQLGGRGDVLADVNLDLGGEGDLHTVGLGDLGEVTVGAAIDVGDRDDVRARGKRLEDHGSGGATGREGEGVLGVFEGRHHVLKVFAIRVGGPRVLILANRLADGRLRKGRREGDGGDHGTAVSTLLVGGLGRRRRSRKGGDTYVLGSCSEPAWTALVPKPDEGEEALGGVVIVILYVLLVGECEPLVVM